MLLRAHFLIPVLAALLPAAEPAAPVHQDAASHPMALPRTAVTISVAAGGHQVFDGFGTSVGNWQGGYQKLSVEDRQRLARSLWGELGFTTLRLWVNLDEVSPEPGRIDITEFRARYIDSGLIADARRHGVKTLLLAPEHLPPYLAESTADGTALKADAAEAYAHLVAGFIVRLRDDTGVVLDASGLQNEPNDKQHIGPQQLATIAKRLRRDLDAARLPQLKLVGPENGSVDGLFYDWVDHLRGDPEAWAALSAVGSHSYNMAATAEAEQRLEGKPYWMTETSDNGPEAPGDAHRAATLAARFLNDVNHGVGLWVHFLGFELDDPRDNATRIIALKPDGSGWTTFLKYDYYRRLSAAFRPGAVFRRSATSLPEGMTWTYGKKPRLTAACARNSDGTWAIGLCNYTAEAFSDRGDTGRWEVDQEGRPATTCAVTLRIAELADTGEQVLEAWRCDQDGAAATPTRVTMRDGVLTLDVAPFELITLRSVR